MAVASWNKMQLVQHTGFIPTDPNQMMWRNAKNKTKQSKRDHNATRQVESHLTYSIVEFQCLKPIFNISRCRCREKRKGENFLWTDERYTLNTTEHL